LFIIYRLQDHVGLSQVTTMTIRIRVKDSDDQNPVFSQDVYTASVSETASITVSYFYSILTLPVLSFIFWWWSESWSDHFFSSRSLTTREVFFPMILPILLFVCVVFSTYMARIFFPLSLVLFTPANLISSCKSRGVSLVVCLPPGDLLFCHAFGRRSTFLKKKMYSWCSSLLHLRLKMMLYLFFSSSTSCCSRVELTHCPSPPILLEWLD